MTDERTREARRNAIAMVRARIEGDDAAMAALLLPDSDNPAAVADMVDAVLALAAELVQIVAPQGNWRSVLDEMALRAADERFD